MYLDTIHARFDRAFRSSHETGNGPFDFRDGYGAVNLEGALFVTREAWNRAYYGEDVRAIDILVSGTASNPGADPLRRVIADAATAVD